MPLLFNLIVRIGKWYDDLDVRRMKDPVYRNLQINRLARQMQEEADTFYKSKL